MSIASSCLVCSLCALSVMACQELNPVFCADHPNDITCLASVGGGSNASSCTSNAQCAAPTPICDTATSMCVQCTDDDLRACRGTTPVCGDDNSCHSCVADAECESLTCLPDGACAAAGSVLYVAMNGSRLANCTPDDRCALARALALMDGTKVVIRLDPGMYHSDNVPFDIPVNMHIVGRGAAFDQEHIRPGSVLSVVSGAVVTLDYLTLRGAIGDTGNGIFCVGSTVVGRNITIEDNGGAGISAVGCTVTGRDITIQRNTGGGISAVNSTVTLTRARVASNIGLGISAVTSNVVMVQSNLTKNLGGGVSLASSAFRLQNNLLALNGNVGSTLGGILLSGSVRGGPFEAQPRVLEFNTIATNVASTVPSPGVQCNFIDAPLAFASNIVFGNIDIVVPATSQVGGGNCNWAYSDIGPEPLTGTGNISSDPQFVDPVRLDYHLKLTSPARDTADPAATLAVDIDGDVRPQGAGRDMGADEIK